MKKVLVVFLTLFSIFCVFISAQSDCIRGSGGGGTPFSATDDFNRSNADALGALSGGTYTWTEVSGDSDIESNQAHFASMGTQAVCIVGADDQSEGYVEADVNGEGSIWGHYGVIFWYEDINNFWYAELFPNGASGNDIQLIQVVSGSHNEVADASFSAISSTTYTLRATYSSSQVVVSVDTTDYLTHSGSFGSNAGDVGFRQYRGGGNTQWHDNFEAGE